MAKYGNISINGINNVDAKSIEDIDKTILDSKKELLSLKKKLDAKLVKLNEALTNLDSSRALLLNDLDKKLSIIDDIKKKFPTVKVGSFVWSPGIVNYDENIRKSLSINHNYDMHISSNDARKYIDEGNNFHNIQLCSYFYGLTSQDTSYYRLIESYFEGHIFYKRKKLHFKSKIISKKDCYSIIGKEKLLDLTSKQEASILEYNGGLRKNIIPTKKLPLKIRTLSEFNKKLYKSNRNKILESLESNINNIFILSNNSEFYNDLQLMRTLS